MMILRGFAPVLNSDTHTLILGSFPSAASLVAGQYYAHRQNQFWRMLGAILQQPLPDMPYAARWPFVQAAGIGVWDVYATCEREGSLDSDIRLGVPNDFVQLRTWAPQLQRICFNGQVAARFQREFVRMGYVVSVLPSTSPAYTLNFEKKLAVWRATLGGS